MKAILVCAFVRTHFPPGIDSETLIKCLAKLMDKQLGHDDGILFQDREEKLNDKFLGLGLSSYLHRICQYSNLPYSIVTLTNYKKMVKKLGCQEYCEINEIQCDDAYQTGHYFGCIMDGASKEEIIKVVDYDGSPWACVVIIRNDQKAFYDAVMKFHNQSKSRANIIMTDSKVSYGLLPPQRCKARKLLTRTVRILADITLSPENLIKNLLFVRNLEIRTNIQTRLKKTGKMYEQLLSYH